jgi:hypothetical protein
MTRRRWVLAGAAALALVAWLLWPRLAGLRASKGHEADAPDTRETAGLQDVGHLDDTHPVAWRNGDHFTLDAITNVAQLEGPEAKRLLSEGDRLELLMLAQQVCDAAQLQRRTRLATEGSASTRQSLAFRGEFARRFCDPTLPHYTEYIERFADLDVGDDTAIALGLRTLEGPEVETIGMPTAARLIRESPSFSAMKRASDFLILSGRTLPQVERVPFPPNLRDVQSRLDAQRMAVDRVVCAMRGGCGPLGLNTMAWCGPCGPSVTLEQSWQRHHPPEVIAYSRALAAAIEADRRRAGAH